MQAGPNGGFACRFLITAKEQFEFAHVRDSMHFRPDQRLLNACSSSVSAVVFPSQTPLF